MQEKRGWFFWVSGVIAITPYNARELSNAAKHSKRRIYSTETSYASVPPSP